MTAVQPYIESQPTEITPMTMLDRAVASGASIETLTKLMELQERWDKNQARKAFDEALADAKSEIGPIFKNKTVSHGQGKAQFRHEDIAEIARTVGEPLAKHGLSYRWRTSTEGNLVSVTCIISHRLGHSEENTLISSPDVGQARNAIQAVGSAITYLQRYTLKAALGLAASDDDDGRAAGNGPVITDDQATEIMGLITDTNSNVVKMLEYVKAPSVADMNVEQYTKAKTLLLQKKGERK
jgi:hypothetical protein